MRNPFQPGDRKEFRTQVTEAKLARFEAGLVHPVYSTFALGQDAEWVCRLFVLEMLEPHEEGLGSRLTVQHLAPALLGADVVLTAELIAVDGNQVRCRWWAEWNTLRIAEGEQTQHIVDRERWTQRLARLQDNPAS